MGSFNKSYARFYDLLYVNKDYKQEYSIINKLIKKHFNKPKNLLDIGCGTGKYSSLLTKMNLKVVGLDKSHFMIKEAKRKFKTKKNLSFKQSDLKTFESKEKFDIVSALFHILSYQTTNSDVDKFFKTSHKILSSKGVVVFDFWFKPGVLFLKQPNKFRKVVTRKNTIIRLTTSNWNKKNNRINDVHEMLILDKKNKLKENFTETHKMRYFDLNFIKKKLKKNKFIFLSCIDIATNKFPTKNSWGALVLAKKLVNE